MTTDSTTPRGRMPALRRIASITLGAVLATVLTTCLAANAPAAQHLVYPSGANAAGDIYAKQSLRGALRARLVGYPRTTISLAALRRSGSGSSALVSPGGQPLAGRSTKRVRSSRSRTRGIVVTTRQRMRSAYARPDTWITRGPRAWRKTSSSRARLSFGTDVGARFQCSLDGRTFRRCRSGVSYRSLKPGRHSFRVRALGRGGIDVSPARRVWFVGKGKGKDSTTRPTDETTSMTPGTPALPTGFGDRPYDADSPWNTPIPGNAGVLPQSSTYVNSIVDNGQKLSSDPDQYALPIYEMTGSESLRPVKCGSWRNWPNGDRNPSVSLGGGTTQQVPVPAGAVQSDGSDGQIIFWNVKTGDYWEFWQFKAAGSGSYTCTSGRHSSTAPGNLGRFADGTGGRGAGTSYLAGTVRPWEIAQGRIDHALAFAYSSPGGGTVYPASKSDGAGGGGDAPEGTRFQLDPSLTDADFTAWGLSPEAKVIARAMQQYGMYVIDNSGSSKIYLEDRLTAKWPASITRNLTANIPLSKFRAVEGPAPR